MKNMPGSKNSRKRYFEKMNFGAYVRKSAMAMVDESNRNGNSDCVCIDECMGVFLNPVSIVHHSVP